MGPILNAFDVERERGAWQADASVKGIIGLAPGGYPCLIAPERKPQLDRFLQARSLFVILSGATNRAPRLSPARARGSRRLVGAFAAELLAPAEALRQLLVAEADDDRIDELADEFQVSSSVIQHQVENRLACHQQNR